MRWPWNNPTQYGQCQNKLINENDGPMKPGYSLLNSIIISTPGYTGLIWWPWIRSVHWFQLTKSFYFQLLKPQKVLITVIFIGWYQAERPKKFPKWKATKYQSYEKSESVFDPNREGFQLRTRSFQPWFERNQNHKSHMIKQESLKKCKIELSKDRNILDL